MVINVNRFFDIIACYGFVGKIFNELFKLCKSFLHKPAGMLGMDDMGEGYEKTFILKSGKSNPDIEGFTHMYAAAAVGDQVQIIIILLEPLVGAVM